MRRPKPSFLSVIDDALIKEARRYNIHGSLLIAVSGGIDSIVLLDSLARARDAGTLPDITRLYAIHVHHGLSKNADSWQIHVERECEARAIPLFSRYVDLKKMPQQSLEEAARNARYAAFSEVLKEIGAQTLVLAHHQDDQAETLLLQLLRGAGPRGLSAMAAYQPLNGLAFLWRPFLLLPREALLRYGATRRLMFVLDESNENLNFKRNFLRHRVFPEIEKAFPAYRKTLARAALLQAQTVAAMKDHGQYEEARFPMSLAHFQKLSDEIARQELRHAIGKAGLRAPSFAHVSEMARQLKTARADAMLSLKIGDEDFLGVHRGQILRYQKTPPYSVAWQGEATLKLPRGVLLCVKTCVRVGVKINLSHDVVRVTSRAAPHETIKRAGRPNRALGDLLREAGVPHWARDTYPRVYVNGELIAVPNIAVAETAQTTASEEGVVFTFEATL